MHTCGSSHDSRESETIHFCALAPKSRHVSKATPGHPRLFFLLFDTTYLNTCSIDGDWNQTKPVRHFATDSLAIWPTQLQTKVMRPSSASTSAVSTRRSIIPCERTASNLIENDLTTTVAALEDSDVFRISSRR